MPIAALLLTLALQAPSQPTFKSGVNVVEVDVVVTDASGQPVRGLRQQDFDVFEDGKPVEIAAFTAVDIPAAPPGAPLPAADRSGVALASNDQPHDGRVVLIVLDDFHVSFDGGRIVTAKAVARRLVERLGPSDQAAIIATSGRSSLQSEFTGDKARLVEAIDTFFPQAEYGAGDIAGRAAAGSGRSQFDFIQELKSRSAMETLSNAVKTLALIPHRRKAVLLVSQGLPASVEAIISNANAGAAWQSMRDFILTAQRSNVSIYPIDPCGLALDDGCSTASRDNLRSLAEETGGFAVTNTNAPETGVDRMMAESGTYYLIGYYSPAPENDGKRHRIQVRSRAPGVEIRARSGYISPRRASSRPSPLPLLDALIGAPIQTRGLSMRIAAVPAPLATGPGSTVAVGIELSAAEAIRAGRVELSLVAVDAEGKVRARQRSDSTFKPLTTAAPRGWIRLGSRVDVPPGRYQIRVAAILPDGVRGSVFTDVTVPKFGDDLALGGLSLGATALVTAGRADIIAEVLPLMPLATREAPPATPLAAQLPIRASARAAAGPLAIVTALVRPDGSRLQLDDSSTPATNYTRRAGGVYRLNLPQNLPPGAYRLTIEASQGGKRATRELPFRILEQRADW